MKNKIFFEVTTLKNLTTEINMLKKQIDSVTEAVEYSHEHLVFELDERSCNKGQLTQLEGIIHMKNQKHKFSAEGKITEINKIEDGRMKVTMELHSYDKKIWKEFIQLLDSQQKELDRIFNSMRDDI